MSLKFTLSRAKGLTHRIARVLDDAVGHGIVASATSNPTQKGRRPMVHEGFTASTGRTVLVRTDDLSPRERADVSEFFWLVKRLAWLDGLPREAGFSVGAFGLFVTFIVSLGTNNAVGCIIMYCATAIVGAVSYALASAHARKHTPAAFEELVAIGFRSERCRIAATQLRQASELYAKLLPQLDVPATAS